MLVPRQLRMFARPCRSRRTQVPKPRLPRSTTPRTATTPCEAVKAFESTYGAKWPTAVAKISDDVEVLLAFYDFAAEHWVHLRTTNPIVIWSPPDGVLDVRHEVSRSLVLRGGHGYLQSSRRQSLRRDDARCTGYFSGLVA